MKKSTLLIIMLTYLASIVIVGIFGMSIKVYNPSKYIKTIEMSAEAEDSNMFLMSHMGYDNVNGNLYKLTVYFNKYFQLDENNNKYLSLNLIPYITYKTGDVGGGEGIIYDISKPQYQEKGYINLTSTGELNCYASSLYFVITVKPERSSGNGTSSIIQVFVL